MLKLIRFPNLIIVVLTQWLLYQVVLCNYFDFHDLVPELDWVSFWVMVGATVCTAAAGYVINDIFDQQIDLKNKPEQVIIGRKISVQQAYLFYYTLVGFGALCSLYLFWKNGRWFWIPEYIWATAMMYFYSKKWKGQVLIGNLVVAAFCALVAIMVFACDAPTIFSNQLNIHQIPIEFFAIGYILFAFWSTLYREIVKDIEDMEGDQAEGCQTLPIVYGLSNAKKVAGLVCLILVGLTYYGIAFCVALNNLEFQAYLIFAILVPILMSAFFLFKAKTTKEFHELSTIIKVVMLLGLLGVLMITL